MESMNKKTTSNAAAELGRRGGRAVAKKHGKGYMKALGKKGATKRWADKENGNSNSTKNKKAKGAKA